jgi:hypothetical protein
MPFCVEELGSRQDAEPIYIKSDVAGPAQIDQLCLEKSADGRFDSHVVAFGSAKQSVADQARSHVVGSFAVEWLHQGNAYGDSPSSARSRGSRSIRINQSCGPFPDCSDRGMASGQQARGSLLDTVAAAMSACHAGSRVEPEHSVIVVPKFPTVDVPLMSTYRPCSCAFAGNCSRWGHVAPGGC